MILKKALMVKSDKNSGAVFVNSRNSTVGFIDKKRERCII